jgi:hypothetical protein
VARVAQQVLGHVCDLHWPPPCTAHRHTSPRVAEPPPLAVPIHTPCSGAPHLCAAPLARGVASVWMCNTCGGAPPPPLHPPGLQVHANTVVTAAEACSEELAEDAVVSAAGLHLVRVWDSTLVHADDLPADARPLPLVFTTFRTAVERAWRVRPQLPLPPAGALAGTSGARRRGAVGANACVCARVCVCVCACSKARVQWRPWLPPGYPGPRGPATAAPAVPALLLPPPALPAHRSRPRCLRGRAAYRGRPLRPRAAAGGPPGRAAVCGRGNGGAGSPDRVPVGTQQPPAHVQGHAQRDGGPGRLLQTVPVAVAGLAVSQVCGCGCACGWGWGWVR